MSILWQASINRLLDFAENFITICARAGGPLFVAVAVSLLSLAIYTFHAVTLRVLQLSTTFYVFNIIVSSHLAILLFFNYFKAITTHPGTTEPFQIASDSNISDTETAESQPLNAPAPDPVRRCKKCNMVKPARAHHCGVCNSCILRMDHHCPWINGCVGHYNHRYFYLFCFYLFIGCVYFFVAGFPVIRAEYLLGKSVKYDSMSVRVLFLFSFILSFAIGVAVGALTAWHTYLILTAQTTIEYYAYKDARELYKHDYVATVCNDYDLGTIRNFKFFFNIGKRYPWWTLCLPMSVPPACDGAHWPSIRDLARTESDVVWAELP